MKNILVTGGAGFIAFYLAKELSAGNDRVTIIDNFSRNKEDVEFSKLLEKANVRFINADMTSKDFLEQLDDYYDEIYHLAAINGTKYFYSKPYEVLRVNILALMNLLEWVNEKNCGKFLFSSSSEAYAGTISMFSQDRDFVPTKEDIPLCIDNVFNERFSYGGSKLAGELLVINYFKKVKTPFAVVRYHNIYGPRMGFDHVIPEFVKRIHKKENPFSIFGGTETRAFCYIDDAVEATIMVMRSEKCHNQVVHIGNDKEEIAIIDLAKLALQLAGSDAEVEIKPSPAGSVKRRCPDISKIASATGFYPKTSLKEGLKKSLDWYLAEYKRQESQPV